VSLLEVWNLRTYFPGRAGRPADPGRGRRHLLPGREGEPGPRGGVRLREEPDGPLDPPPRPEAGLAPGGEILYRGKNVFGMSYRERTALRGGQIAMIFQEPQTSLNPS